MQWLVNHVEIVQVSYRKLSSVYAVLQSEMVPHYCCTYTNKSGKAKLVARVSIRPQIPASVNNSRPLPCRESKARKIAGVRPGRLDVWCADDPSWHVYGDIILSSGMTVLQPEVNACTRDEQRSWRHISFWNACKMGSTALSHSCANRHSVERSHVFS